MEKKYINERLEDQISWYNKKSQSNKKYFESLKIIEILSASLIPFLVAYVNYSFIQIVIGALGIIIAVIASLLSLFKFQENWIEYRTTSETLKHHKYLYETKCHPYNNDDDRLCKLVQICELIISKENSNWADYIKNTKNTDGQQKFT